LVVSVIKIYEYSYPQLLALCTLLY